MIIDDKKALIGSANINDRSLLGLYDSELAVCIEGPPTLEVDSGFGPVLVNPTINEFRRRLFAEHFGVDVPFPQGSHAWALIWSISQVNTFVFDKVFKCYPSDKYSSWKELQERKRQIYKEDIRQYVPLIKGHAVLYPYKFLQRERLAHQRSSEISTLIIPIFVLY